jgi:RNA polymerase subunit RPABC4/transcription elongation factor Spt4
MSSEFLDKSENLPASNLKRLSRAWFGLVIILMVLFSAYAQTVAFEITCTRTLGNEVECQIVQHSILRKFPPIQVKHPLAVDVTQKKPLIHSPEMGNGSGKKPYKAEMRVAGKDDTLILISSLRYETIQKIADTINRFLQDTSISSFQAYLPEGRMMRN